MSYRNPQQVVDTQSSQHIQKMQESISNTFGKFANATKEEYERRAALNREIIKESQQKVNAISGKINQVASQNESIDFSQMRDNLSTYHEYMQISPSDRTPEMNLFITGMNTSGDVVKNQLANTMANGQTYIEARKKGLGKMGGLYSGGGFAESDKGEPVSQIKKFDIFYGVNGAKGRKVLGFDPVTGKTRIEVFDENGISLGSSLNSTMEDLDEMQYVPDETKDMTALANKVAAQMDLKNVNSPAYKGQSLQEIKAVNGKKTYSYLPSRDYFLKLAKPLAEAELASMPAGDQIALYNDVTRGDNDVVKHMKVWEDENDPLKQQIIDSYAEYTADKFAQQHLKIALQADTKRAEGAGSGSGSGSETKADKLNAASEGFAVMLYDLGEDLSYNNLESVADNLSLSNAEQVVDVETNPWVSLEKESVSKEFRGPSSRKASFKKGDSPKQMAIKAISVKYGYNPNEATKVYEESLKKVEILKKRYKDVESEFEKSASSGLKGDARAAMKKAYIKRHFRTTF